MANWRGLEHLKPGAQNPGTMTKREESNGTAYARLSAAVDVAGSGVERTALYGCRQQHCMPGANFDKSSIKARTPFRSFISRR